MGVVHHHIRNEQYIIIYERSGTSSYTKGAVHHHIQKIAATSVRHIPVLVTGILGLSFLLLLKQYGWCALLRCSSDTRSVCLPHFSCGTYMAGVPFCFVSARCVYISSASTFAYSGYGQVFFNSVVATATSKITACHIRS